MAKKNKPGPQKECPGCKKMVHARTKNCECGHTFEYAVKTTKPAKATVAKQLDLESALPLVNSMGGVKALQTAIDAYRKAEATLQQLGGVDRAEALHVKLEELRAVLGKG